MPNYQVLIVKRAAKELAALTPSVRKRIDRHILELAENPRPPGAVALQGGLGYLRIRVGEFRVIYEVQDARLVVLLLRVGHRREVYR
jgi:mRNA interferase RelE/StbE